VKQEIEAKTTSAKMAVAWSFSLISFSPARKVCGIISGRNETQK
jgi:hypothetical protein